MPIFAYMLPEGGTRLCDINDHDGLPDPPRNTQAITVTVEQTPGILNHQRQTFTASARTNRTLGSLRSI
jgi:hypothetical protein